MFTSMSDVIAANRAAGMHFFDADTMRFFGSRVLNTLYFGRYFISSEWDSPNRETRTRRYTVRKANLDGSIDKVGQYCQHATAAQARGAIRGLTCSLCRQAAPHHGLACPNG